MTNLDKKVTIKANDFKFSEHEEGIRQKFKPYKEIIEGLTKMYIKETDHDIISCMMTYDSSRIIVVLKVNDEHYIINQYDSENFKRTFTQDIKGNYIKCKDVVQNNFGILFCAPYLDDGVFRLLVFNRYEVLAQANLNGFLNIDNSTRPNDNFPDPMMGAAFIEYNNIFVNVFYTKSQTMHICKYSFLHKKLVDEPILMRMEQSSRNFPLNTFYDDERNHVYIFYRQGESVTIDLANPKDLYTDKLTNFDMGNTFLYNNQVLIVKSSSQILFYRLNAITNNITKKTQLKWLKYYMLDI